MNLESWLKTNLIIAFRYLTFRGSGLSRLGVEGGGKGQEKVLPLNEVSVNLRLFLFFSYSESERRKVERSLLEIIEDEN